MLPRRGDRKDRLRAATRSGRSVTPAPVFVHAWYAKSRFRNIRSLTRNMPLIIRITDEDVERFSLASLDFNPLHCSDDYARKTSFGQRVAHGMLGFLASLRGLTVPVSTAPSRITIDCKSALLLNVDYELRVLSES